MQILTVDGNVRALSQSILCAIPTKLVAEALLSIVAASMYCIPVKSWFLLSAFPRLQTPNALPVPSLRLMQRMSQLVATRGSAGECEQVIQAAHLQATRRGAPWSWFALDMPVLLNRCSPSVLHLLLAYYTTQYRGARQYAAVILPMLLNAMMKEVDVSVAGVRRALLWVLENFDVCFPALNPCYKMACIAALPIPERRMYLEQTWAAVFEKQSRTRDEVLVLSNRAGIMPYLLPFIHARETEVYEHEAIWNWIVRSMPHDGQMLREVLPPAVHACMENWMPMETHAAHETTASCCICMEDFSAAGASCVTLSRCRHVFHAACLFKWIKKKKECPMCRAPTSNTVVTPARSQFATLPFIELNTQPIWRYFNASYDALFADVFEPSSIIAINFSM